MLVVPTNWFSIRFSNDDDFEALTQELKKKDKVPLSCHYHLWPEWLLFT